MFNLTDYNCLTSYKEEKKKKKTKLIVTLDNVYFT